MEQYKIETHTLVATLKTGPDIKDITHELQERVSTSNINNGTIHIFNRGSTGSITTIEYEPGAVSDLKQAIARLAPPGIEYAHELAWHDGNGHSHLQATTLGPEISVPIAGGQPRLGTWQQIFHLECDNKPHERRIVVTVRGE